MCAIEHYCHMCYKILLDMHRLLYDIFIASDIRPKSLPYHDLYITYRKFKETTKNII